MVELVLGEVNVLDAAIEGEVDRGTIIQKGIWVSEVQARTSDVCRSYKAVVR